MDNRRRLFLASFMTLIAAGIGFSIRGSILGAWAAQYGFTKAELGGITGMGLVGFGLTIIVGSAIAARIGYRVLMMVAFGLHFLSAVITIAATPVFHAYGKDATSWCLQIGMFVFALANGTAEAVINPLVARLYEKEKTHYLNILHAGWPGGLVAGAALAMAFSGVRWELQWALIIPPTLIYGFMLVGQKFPAPDAAVQGVTLGTMMRQLLRPTFLVLLALQALVGYVELGTDMWITQLTGEILANPSWGLGLFIYTSLLMFALRFVAGPIVHKISALGLLLVSSVLGAVGLLLIGGAATLWTTIFAVTVYALGKTFLWPTMLGVVADRFPRGGAMTLGVVGGVGMISAGLLGGPGIGYKQDYYAAEKLRSQSPEAFERFVSTDERRFLVFPSIAGLDGAKVAALMEKPPEALTAADQQDKGLVATATLHGSRMALRWTAVVPMVMAVGYLGLMLYFTARGKRDEEEPIARVAGVSS